MKDIKELDNKKLVEVAGGSYDPEDEDENRKPGPCKYCGQFYSLALDDVRGGWEGGRQILCRVYKCEKCGKDSYYSTYDGHLLM